MTKKDLTFSSLVRDIDKKFSHTYLPFNINTDYSINYDFNFDYSNIFVIINKKAE